MPLAQHPHTPPDWVKFRRKRGWRTGVRNFFDIVAPIESVANGLLPRIIAEYHIARPAIELRVREGVHGAVLEDIRSGVADLGITFVDELPDTIAMVPLGREVFHAVMPRQHRLAPSRGVTMKQIGREPLVSLPNDSRTRRTIDAAASKPGITDEGAVSIAATMSRRTIWRSAEICRDHRVCRTRRWRELDSNYRFREEGLAFFGITRHHALVRLVSTSRSRRRRPFR